MPTEYEASLIKIRRDTAQNWADRNPILSEGEIGIEWTDETRSTCYIKVGNGVTHYNDLNYFLGSELDGEKTPFLDFGLFNDDTLPTINGVKITGDLSLENLGIQPIGSYVTSESLVQGLALKADKTDIYTKDDMDGILNDLRVLPDYTGEDNKYLKIVGGIPTYVNLSEDVVSRDVLQEALDKKVDKAVGYTLVNENEYRGILQTLSEWEKYNIPDMRDDITNLENEIDAKVNTEELDNYLTKEEFQGTLDGYASKDELVKKANAADLTNHIHDHQNPHNVTLEQLGISEEYKKYPPLLLPVSEAVQAELNEKQDKFTVGFGLKMESGELSNTSPNIQSDWLAEEGQSDAAILNKPLLATVATTGSYNDLKDKPDLSQNVLKPAQKEVLGGIKLGEDFVLDEDDHLKYISGIVDYNDLKNKPSFKDIDGTIYPLIPEMTARDLNLASLTVAKAIDQRLQEEKADKVDLEALKEEVSKLPKAGEYYTKEEADEKFLTEYQDISGKADKATTLEGYGIQDAYNQIQIDNMLAEKADKGEIDGKQDKLTDEQLAAVNSGITAEKLEELENRTNTFTEEQMAAINSGVTFETVEQVSDNKTNIETLTERLDNISGEIGDGFVKAKVVSENERYTSEIIHEKGDYSNNLRLQYSYKNGDVDREYDDRTVLIQDSSNLTLHAYSYPQDAQYTSYSGIDVSPRGISLIGTTDFNSEMRPYPEEETIEFEGQPTLNVGGYGVTYCSTYFDTYMGEIMSNGEKYNFWGSPKSIGLSNNPYSFVVGSKIANKDEYGEEVLYGPIFYASTNGLYYIKDYEASRYDRYEGRYLPEDKKFEIVTQYNSKELLSDDYVRTEMKDPRMILNTVERTGGKSTIQHTSEEIGEEDEILITASKESNTATIKVQADGAYYIKDESTEPTPGQEIATKADLQNITPSEIEELKQAVQDLTTRIDAAEQAIKELEEGGTGTNYQSFDVVLMHDNWYGSDDQGNVKEAAPYNNLGYVIQDSRISPDKEVDFGLPVPTTRSNAEQVSKYQMVITQVEEGSLTLCAKTLQADSQELVKPERDMTVKLRVSVEGGPTPTPTGSNDLDTLKIISVDNEFIREGEIDESVLDDIISGNGYQGDMVPCYTLNPLSYVEGNFNTFVYAGGVELRMTDSNIDFTRYYPTELRLHLVQEYFLETDRTVFCRFMSGEEGVYLDSNETVNTEDYTETGEKTVSFTFPLYEAFRNASTTGFRFEFLDAETEETVHLKLMTNNTGRKPSANTLNFGAINCRNGDDYRPTETVYAELFFRNLRLEPVSGNPLLARNETSIGYEGDKYQNLLTGNEYRLFGETVEEISYPNLTKLNMVGDEIYSSIKSIHFPELTEIVGDYLGHNFDGLVGELTEEQLPKLEHMSDSVFTNATKLTLIRMPKLKALSQCAFWGCTNVQEIDLPEIESFERFICYNCQQLRVFNAPKVRTIYSDSYEVTSWGVFSNNGRLRELYLPSVQEIKSQLMVDCSAIEKLQLTSLKEMPEDVQLPFLSSNTVETAIDLCNLRNWNFDAQFGTARKTIYVSSGLHNMDGQVTTLPSNVTIWTHFADAIAGAVLEAHKGNATIVYGKTHEEFINEFFNGRYDGPKIEYENGPATIYSYRIKEDDSDPSTRVEYLGENLSFTPCKMNFSSNEFEWGDWANAFFIPKPCALRFDGTVDYYLNPNDFTKKAEGGDSDVTSMDYNGNFMMEFPKIFVKFYKEDGYLYVYVADNKLDDMYECWSCKKSDGSYAEHFYLPMFEGTLDSENRLRSVGTNTAATRGTSAENEATYAEANGSGWYTTLWSDELLMWLLFPLLFKSTNSQLALGYGALGSIYNNTSLTNGLMYGTSSSSNYGITYLGLHNWWKNRWRRCNGLMNNNGKIYAKMTPSTVDGSRVEGFNRTGSGYIDTGYSMTGSSGNHISIMTPKETYGIFPSGSGSNTTYYCNVYWFSTSDVKQLYLGGYSDYAADAGLYYFGMDRGPTDSDNRFGASISYHPNGLE